MDISDAVLLARLAVEDRTLRISDAQKRAGDCNHDGRTNADDLTAMLQYLAKLIPALDAPTKENATAA